MPAFCVVGNSVRPDRSAWVGQEPGEADGYRVADRDGDLPLHGPRGFDASVGGASRDDEGGAGPPRRDLARGGGDARRDGGQDDRGWAARGVRVRGGCAVSGGGRTGVVGG